MNDWIFLSTKIAVSISDRLKELNVSPAYIANGLNLSSEEVFTTLSGRKNFTLRDIARLEVLLGKELLVVNKPYDHE